MNLEYWLGDVRDAASGLKRRWVRSLLSTLGIAIGVASLVAMLSISEGAKQQALDKYQNLGVSTLRLEKKNADQLALSSSFLNATFTDTELEKLRHNISADTLLGYFYRGSPLSATYNGRIHSTDIFFVNPQWMDLEGISIARGRSLGEVDLMRRSTQCVLGSALAKSLRMAEPFGILSLGQWSCQVIGVASPKGRLVAEGSGLSAIDFDNSLYLPVTSYFERVKDNVIEGYDGVVIKLPLDDEAEILASSQRIEQFMQRWIPALKSYQLVIPVNMLLEARETHKLFSLVMGAIAGMSLLVGGIGIMNVMLAHIAEQTREIGLRMSVGAEPYRIALLFVVHSVLLCIIGSVIGLVFGVIFAYVVQIMADWKVAFSANSVLVGPFFSLITGVVFGIYPALRASQLDPAIMLKEV